jgi:putative ATPase
MSIPLAERIRPKSFKDYISQEHLVGPNGQLTKQLANGLLSSMILWGPPGIGKTTLAHIIANTSDRPFYKLSAINSGVKEIREVINIAKKEGGIFTPKNPILFIDEIHRFSKSQQDSLLEAVEKGWVTLIGATTENPSFEVISALLSRCQVYVLEPFDKLNLEKLLQHAIEKDEVLKSKTIELQETNTLIALSGGDARKLLNILEIVVNSFQSDETILINNTSVSQSLNKNILNYDKSGDNHYDIISAFIKSIRGSDPNAAVYYLARMIEAGEDPKFIGRRLIISASEDIGLANPTALVIANNTFQAIQNVGMPESRIILSQCTIYLATSPKSNSAYEAINKAQELVNNTGNLSVPMRLRNAPTKLMKELGYGENYKYCSPSSRKFCRTRIYA